MKKSPKCEIGTYARNVASGGLGMVTGIHLLADGEFSYRITGVKNDGTTFDEVWPSCVTLPEAGRTALPTERRLYEDMAAAVAESLSAIRFRLEKLETWAWGKGHANDGSKGGEV